jgi:hypothetical protein
MVRSGRNYQVDAALRAQPARAGPDFWRTPPCLIGALIAHVEPHLPAGSVWEPAAGDGRLADAMRRAGRAVFASDIWSCDFLTDPPPGKFAAIVTNPPFNKLDAFTDRALEHLDAGVTQSVVLLMRWDQLTAESRTRVLGRAAEIRLFTWRPIWIEGTTTSPRWSFCRVTWRGISAAHRYIHGPVAKTAAGSEGDCQ